MMERAAMEEPLISVVVPVYNAEETLAPLAEAIFRHSPGGRERTEIILVDDKSTDGSRRVMDGLSQEGIKVRFLPENVGQQKATFLGLQEASGRYAVTMDDDLETPPQLLGELYRTILEGWDVVYGIPVDGRGRRPSWYRQAGSRLRDLFFLWLTGERKLRVSSYRMMTRETKDRVCRSTHGFIYISAILLEEPVQVTGIPYERTVTKSTYTFRKLFWVYANLIKEYGHGRKKGTAAPRTKDSFVGRGQLSGKHCAKGG